MAGFRRRTHRRKRVSRRKRSSGSGVWTIAKKAAKSLVKYYLNPEYKFLDYGNSINPNFAGTVIFDVCKVAYGDSNMQRIGNSLKITSWLLRMVLTKNATATASNVRIIAFSDVSSAGVKPNVTDVLEYLSPISPIAKNNGSRFRILMDRIYVLDSDNPMRVTKMYKRLSHHIKYLDGTTNDSALGQGSLYLLILSNEGTNLPTVTFDSRMRFLDN